MSDNKKLITLCLAGMILSACETINIPDAYNLTVKESINNPYGCWMIVTLNYPRDTVVLNSIAGELICMDTDTIYLLAADRYIQPVYSGSVKTAELLTHKNQAGNYAFRTSLFLAPNFIGAVVHASEFGGYFLGVGIPVTLVGFSLAIIEGSSRRNILQYPEKNDLENFKIFARFPFGKPDNIDLNQLTIKGSTNDTKQ